MSALQQHSTAQTTACHRNRYRPSSASRPPLSSICDGVSPPSPSGSNTPCIVREVTSKKKSFVALAERRGSRWNGRVDGAGAGYICSYTRCSSNAMMWRLLANHGPYLSASQRGWQVWHGPCAAALKQDQQLLRQCEDASTFAVDDGEGTAIAAPDQTAQRHHTGSARCL